MSGSERALCELQFGLKVGYGPLDFIARLATLVPKPRVNVTRFHGVFAPNSRYRGRMTSEP